MFSLSGAAQGGADALEELLRTEFLKIQERNRVKAAEDQRRVQMRGQDITLRGQDQLQGRFDTSRTDAQSAATTAKAERERKAAEEKAAIDAFVHANPHLAGVVQARGVGLNVKDSHELETDEAHAPHVEAETQRGLKTKQAENDISVRGQLRVAAAQGAEQRKTAGARIRMAGETQPQQTPYTDERGTRIRESVSALKGKINGWTAGAGSLLTAIPATDARNFKAELDSLKANIAFGELAEMRAASKTGGALGAISERELALLESSLGALDQGQSPQNLAAQLDKIVQSLDRWSQAKASRGLPAAQNANDAGTEFDYVPGKGLVPRKRN